MESNCLVQTHDVSMRLCYVRAIHHHHHRHYSTKWTGNWRHDGLNLGYPGWEIIDSVIVNWKLCSSWKLLLIYLTICSLLPSFWLGFCWLLDRGGVVDEQVFMFGGVDVVGELPEQPTPLTECWYIIESPGNSIELWYYLYIWMLWLICHMVQWIKIFHIKFSRKFVS